MRPQSVASVRTSRPSHPGSMRVVVVPGQRGDDVQPVAPRRPARSTMLVMTSPVGATSGAKCGHEDGAGSRAATAPRGTRRSEGLGRRHRAELPGPFEPGRRPAGRGARRRRAAGAARWPTPPGRRARPARRRRRRPRAGRWRSRPRPGSPGPWPRGPGRRSPRSGTGTPRPWAWRRMASRSHHGMRPRRWTRPSSPSAAIVSWISPSIWPSPPVSTSEASGWSCDHRAKARTSVRWFLWG